MAAVILTCIFALLIGMAAVWMSNLTSTLWPKHHLQKAMEPSPSSVWCHFGPSGEKICRFRNICYSPYFHEFQFFLTEDSVISGIQKSESWMDIDMSTVLGHNAFKMKLAIISPVNKLRKTAVKLENSPTFIIHRFKPDNILHVLHDELIPLYFTTESIFEKTAVQPRQFSIAFSDNFPTSSYDEWYSHFSATPVFQLDNLKNTVCYKEAYVGLYRATLWFDYGFKQPQGAYINEFFNLKGVQNFVNFSLEVWQTNVTFPINASAQQTKVVLLVRSQSRLIVNLDKLKEYVRVAHKEIYPMKELDIVEIDLSVHDITYILSQVSQAKLLVGMHGAGMILALFLPHFASVVELFPFAINPDNVSFLKALFKQHPSFPLHYESWRNYERQNSVPGTHDDPLMGKISHLPSSSQEQILGLSEVPAVKCCHNAAYLYYIFHDTFVSEQLFHSIRKAFKKSCVNSFQTHSTFQSHIYPALPSFVSCEVLRNSVSVMWGEISNLAENDGVWFQITMLNGEHVTVTNVTQIASQKISLDLSSIFGPVQVWFQPFSYKNVAGHIKHKKCIETT